MTKDQNQASAMTDEQILAMAVESYVAGDFIFEKDELLSFARALLSATTPAQQTEAPKDGNVLVPSKYVTGFGVDDGRYTAYGTELGDLKDGTYQVWTAPVVSNIATKEPTA